MEYVNHGRFLGNARANYFYLHLYAIMHSIYFQVCWVMNLDEVQNRLGLHFTDEKLLLEALTHSSCLNEPKMGLHRSNENLAWLGDAVIDWVVSEALYDPDLSKACLTDLRKKYVGKKFLAGFARDLGLDFTMFLPDGQEKEGGRKNQKNLHTVFEAVVGAIFRDKGFDIANRFVLEKTRARVLYM